MPKTRASVQIKEDPDAVPRKIAKKPKGSLISESFSLWLKPPKNCQITLLSTIHNKIICSGRDLALFFGDLSKLKKL
jgi:hypothetical protein